MKKIAIIADDVALPGEKGLDRLYFLSEFLCEQGFSVELITADFQHWEKAYRTPEKIEYVNSVSASLITCIHEYPYNRNIDPKRILSNAVLSANVYEYLNLYSYDMIYALVPDNHLAYTAGRYAKENNIPFIVDIEDLWPEAMKMVFDVPVISDCLYSYFSFFAKKAYKLADAVVGSSYEYSHEPKKYGCYIPDTVTVYVGNDLQRFDKGVIDNFSSVTKPENEFWVTYAGTLGTSYDIETLIRAAAELKNNGYSDIRVKLLGDGPEKENWQALSCQLGAPVDFLGYCKYEYMAAVLSKSDVTVNSLVEKAPQSIVSKIGDYLASGKPMINTGLNDEFVAKVKSDGFGININPGKVYDLYDAIIKLYSDQVKADLMGKRGRAVAVEQFDRRRSYLKIVDLINSLL